MAIAQTVATYDPAQLHATKGTVAEYSLSPRGDVDGLILTDGTEVHLPPHLGTQLVFVVKPGDAVTVRALAIPMVQAMSVSNDSTGKTVVDTGPGGPAGPRGADQPLTASGRIKALLRGPRGDLNGALLDDGTIVRIPPPEATRLSAQLTVGAPMVAQGRGFQGDLGRVIGATAIGPSDAQMHILPGDHDFKPRDLRAYHAVLGAKPLPLAETIAGCRCLFLDVVSAGTGGPDFRLGEEQLAWVERELDEAEAAERPAAIFMHTYPADLREGGERLGTLIARPHVACVDMGHTHYNELANDGLTIFMATRSTGQIEEGPAGFSIAAVDEGRVSWRFKTLDQTWPFVLITSPTDRRLMTGTSAASHGVIRAKVFSDAHLEKVECRVDGGDWHPMNPVSGRSDLFEAGPSDLGSLVEVRVSTEDGREDTDQVEPLDAEWTAPSRVADGSDKDSVGAWPEKGILATQLGPNRNGRKW